MDKRLCIILCAVLLILSASGVAVSKEIADAEGSGLKHVAGFEGGNLFKVGEVRVLELNGNYRQMGRRMNTRIPTGISLR